MRHNKLQSKQKSSTKGFYWLLGVYVALFLADLITTLITPHFQYLETNPLYRLIGALWAPIVLNLLVITALMWSYRRSQPTMRFVFLNIMIIVCFFRILALINAIQRIIYPITQEAALAIGTPAAKTAAVLSMFFTEILLFGLSILTFLFWRIDHEVEKKLK